MNTSSPIWMAKRTTRERALFELTSIFAGNAVQHWQNWKLKQRLFRASSLKDRAMKSLGPFTHGRDSCNGGRCLKLDRGFSSEARRPKS
jgi:hypothetical protein